MCALFSRIAIYEPFLGLAGGSPVCALSRRSIGARNSSEHGALHVVSAHPLADCFCHRGKQADKDCFVYVARRRIDGSRLYVQAGGDRELAPNYRTLSGIRSERNRWRAAISFAAWSGTGLLAVLGFVVLYFFAHGGLRDFVENVFTHNLQYIGAVPASQRLEYCWGTLTTLARSQAILWLFAVAGLLGLFKSGKVTWSALLTGWLITSVIGASASGYFFPHYFQQLLPPLALAVTAGADRLHSARLLRFLPYGIGRALLAAMLAILPVVTLWPFLFTYTAAEAVRRIYPGDFFAEMPHFAQRIEEVTPENKPVFIFGSEPELLFYAHRRSATRYIFLFPLYGPYGDAREKQLAAAAQVESANPSTAIYFPNLLFLTSGTDQYFTDWSRSYMDQNFYVDTLLIADESGTAQMLNVASGVQADVSQAREAVIGAILMRQSPAAP